MNASSNSDVRELIIRKFDILAVISLPESAFQPYASVNTSILLLKRKVKIVALKKLFLQKQTRLDGNQMEMKTIYTIQKVIN